MLKHFFPNPSNRKLQNVPGRLKMHSRATTDFFILSLKSDFDNYFLIFRKFSDISKIFIEPSNIFRKIFFQPFLYFRKLRSRSFLASYCTPSNSLWGLSTSSVKIIFKIGNQLRSWIWTDSANRSVWYQTDLNFRKNVRSSSNQVTFSENYFSPMFFIFVNYVTVAF